MEKQYGEEVLGKIDSSNMENQHEEGVLKKIGSSSIENQHEEEGVLKKIDSSSTENQHDEEVVLKKFDSSCMENQEGGLKKMDSSSMEKKNDEEGLKKMDSCSMEKKNDEEGMKSINSSTTNLEKQYGEPAESYARYWHDPVADDVRIDIQDTYIRPMMNEFFEEEIKGDRDNAGATGFEGENTGRTTIETVEKPMEPGESSQTRYEWSELINAITRNPRS
ncbi:uncharacterized protein LOC113300631 [Papaver somniferum]|uniref:uncharacterized protein LOC113300631 n=1 Tax=Papaver somniferum TaxID=3469 RepID=UPI000E6FABFC|nr:uncharacterized protein LOC113300631 [Papaver somniferum]